MTHGSRRRHDGMEKLRIHLFGENSVRIWTVVGGIAAAITLLVTVSIEFWTPNTQNTTSVPSSSPATPEPSTTKAPTGSLSLPRSKKIGAYSFLLSANNYSPLRAQRPTGIQIREDTLAQIGDIQWREVDSPDQFNSGTRESMVQLPSGTTTPTFTACIAQTASVPSVHAKQGSAFCEMEPGHIIAGVFVKTIDLPASKVGLQVTVWKYFG
jgi:hypothetical protein